MGFLKKLFGKAAPQPQQEKQNPWEWLEGYEYGEDAEVEDAASVVLLLRAPLGREGLTHALTQLPTLLPGVESKITDEWKAGETYGATLSLTWQEKPHFVVLSNRPGALPADEAQQTIHLSSWSEDMVAAMYDHQAHATLTYAGEARKTVQLALLYALATVLEPVGVADPTAHNALPGPLLPEFFTAGTLAEMQDVIPTILWTGIIKFQLPDGRVYYVTRGFERFGLANLAHLAPFGSGEQTVQLFDTLLNYQISSGALLGPGHTSETSTQWMNFREPPEEYAAPLSGGLPVLDVLVRPK